MREKRDGGQSNAVGRYAEVDAKNVARPVVADVEKADIVHELRAEARGVRSRDHAGEIAKILGVARGGIQPCQLLLVGDAVRHAVDRAECHVHAGRWIPDPDCFCIRHPRRPVHRMEVGRPLRIQIDLAPGRATSGASVQIAV